MMRDLLPMLVLLASCGSSGGVTRQDGSEAADYSIWHAEKMEVDLAVAEAINEPNGGDYAKAVQITRNSNRPEAIKNYQIGQLIIGGIARQSTRPAAGTLQQGLELIENAATQPGETRQVAPQQLRMLFERGDGIAPNNIPIDPVIADCWHRLENGRKGDPALCIALRRERLPRIGR